MAGSDPADGAARSNLALRVVSSAVLAPLALFAAWLGGLPFALFWTIAGSIVL
jgi:multidrug efflux pump subunit AcrB